MSSSDNDNKIPLAHQPAGSTPIDQLMDQSSYQQKSYKEEAAALAMYNRNLLHENATLKTENQKLRHVIKVMGL